MKAITATLSTILAAQGLRAPDGRPLYAYRCDEGTIADLAVELHQVVRAGVRLSPQHCAAFCLYASWHFSAAHSEGAWTWDTVVEPLGLAVPYTQLTSIVEAGLGWWRRGIDVLNARTQYMMTLACEGGLPQALLRREGAHIRGFFSGLLHDRERFPATATETLVFRHEHKLPQTWRNDKIRRVSGALIDRIAEFRRLLGSSPQALERLDRERPGWRSELPMRVRDDVALDLIRGLLRAPPPMDTHSCLSIRAFLRSGAERWVLHRQPDAPPIATSSVLAGELAVHEDELPPTFGLHVVFTDGTTRRVATAQRLLGAADSPRYRIESDGVSLKDDDPRTLSELSFSAVAGGRELGRAVPRGGESIDALPWIFDARADDDGQYEGLAVGAFKTTRERVLVVTPEGATIRAEGSLSEKGRVCPPNGVSSTQFHPSTPSLGQRTVWELAGRALIEVGDGDTIIVETGALEDRSNLYRLDGPRIALGQGGSEVWAGPPALLEFAASSTRRLAATSLEWRPAKTNLPYRPVDARCLGDVQLRFRSAGETLFWVRATILPPGAQVRLRGERGRRGSVLLLGVRVLSVRAGLATGVTMEASTEPNQTQIVLDAEAQAPSTVSLWLELAGGVSATLEVPFPSTDSQFVDSGGRILRDNEALSLDELLGSRVQVATAEENAKFVLTGRLYGDWRPESADAAELETLQAQPRDLGALRADGVGRHVLSLAQVYGAVRQLLAMSTDLDAFVALRVESVGGAVISRRDRGEIRIQRYDAWFERSVEQLEGSIRIRPDSRVVARLGSSALAELRVDARRIGDVEAVAYPLVRQDDEIGPAFHLMTAEREPGPWLAIGWEGDHARFRPLLLEVRGPLPEDPPGTLRDASAILDKPTRRAALDRVITALAEDLDHPDWPQVRGVLAQLGRVPSTTYDLVDRLVRSPDAVALAALTMPVGQLRMLWDKLEELPFLWPLVPVRSWVKAIRVLRARDARLFGDGTGDFKEVFADRVRKRLRLLSDEGAWLHAIWDVAHQAIQDVPEPDERFVWEVRSKRASLTGPLAFFREDLRRRHAEDHYPEWGADAVLRRPGIPPALVERFAYRAPPQHEQDVQNAPLAAACVSVFGVSLNRVEVFEFAKLRAFDRAAFDQIYSLILAQLLGETLATNGDF